MRTAIVAAALLAAPEATADDGHRLRVDAGVGYVMLGGQPRTGGPAPSLSGRVLFGAGEHVVVGLGASASAFGFAGGPRWMGGLVGPVASVNTRLSALTIEVEFAADVGRLPVCNAWGLCLRYWGFYPRVGGHVGYQINDRFAIGGSAHVRIVRTLGWEGVSVEPALVGRLSF